jgi:WhiB family redox-sensing transcriptional regulator
VTTFDWRKHAACKNADPAFFFPERSDQFRVSVAKRICEHCPVVEHCLDFALADGSLVGVWGATTADERRQLRDDVTTA